MSFSFTLSSSTVTLAPNSSVSVTITQTSSAPHPVGYGLSTKFCGGWNAPSFIDEHGNISVACSSGPAKITGNGSLTLTFSAKSSVIAQTLVVTIYGLQQTSGDPTSGVAQAQTVTLTIT
jgi:hypothetical protein